MCNLRETAALAPGELTISLFSRREPGSIQPTTQGPALAWPLLFSHAFARSGLGKGRAGCQPPVTRPGFVSAAGWEEDEEHPRSRLGRLQTLQPAAASPGPEQPSDLPAGAAGEDQRAGPGDRRGRRPSCSAGGSDVSGR